MTLGMGDLDMKIIDRDLKERSPSPRPSPARGEGVRFLNDCTHARASGRLTT